MAKQPMKASKPNIGSILDQNPNSIERPKPLPAGSYTAAIKGLYREDKSTKKETPYVEFTFNFLAAGEDVDEEALKEMGGIKDKEMKLTFYLTEKSAYRLKEFLTDDLGIEEMESIREMLDETPGKEFTVFIKQTPTEDGKGVFAEIKSTGPVG